MRRSKGARILSRGNVAGDHFPRIGGEAEKPAGRTLRESVLLLTVFALNRLIPKRPDHAVMHSPVEVEDGLLEVATAMRGRGLTVTFLLAPGSSGDRLAKFAPRGCKILRKTGLRGMLSYLRARYVVVTHGLYGDFSPPPGQTTINLWHGEPGAKVVGRFEGAPGIKCTYAPVCSTMGRAYRAAMFGLDPLQVPVIGAPRNDRMLHADADAMRHTYFGDSTMTFLWLPTFRSARFDAAVGGAKLRSDVTGTGDGGALFSPPELAAIDSWLVANGLRIVVKPHPHDADAFEASSSAITVLRQAELLDNGHTLYELLAATDCLITDVSSVWQDYLLLDRPLIFAFPDIDDYRSTRGINLEPYEAWAPGPLVRSGDALQKELAAVASGADPDGDRRREARRRLHLHPDAESARRLLDGLGLGAP